MILLKRSTLQRGAAELDEVWAMKNVLMAMKKRAL
jgi:hypothetical protein